MLTKANEVMEAGIVTVKSLENLPEKIIRLGWCGETNCGHEIEARTNMNILGTPVDVEVFSGACVVCGKPTKTPVYIANAM